MGTERLRVVIDTNVFVSAFLSKNPSSPTKEIIQRWLANEFSLLMSNFLADEIVEKLQTRGINQDEIVEFMALLISLAEWVEVPRETIQAITADPDDDPILACAILGKASYLVSYDPHLTSLGETYQNVKITEALPFLRALRGNKRLYTP